MKSEAAISGVGSSRTSVAVWALPVWVGVAVVWSYWSVIVGLMREWQRDPNYSVGQLVPFAALYMVWIGRDRFKSLVAKPSYWGIAIIIVALAARAFGLVQLFESAERYALVLTIWGVVLLLCGWAICRRLVWILLFLVLMVPLPGRIHNMISGPLQDYATTGAVYGLEMIGIAVSRTGHRILLDGNIPINVAEECSGLRMLTAFVVVAAVLAFSVRRDGWQKVVLVFSSIPVAIVCNILRLIVTALFFWTHHSELGMRFFHDFAGVTMMPLAVLMLMLELWVMARLVIPDPPVGGEAGVGRTQGTTS